jgi:hypothetical protein
MLPGNHESHVLKILDAKTKRDIPGATARLTLAGLTPDRFHFARLKQLVTLLPNTRYYVVSSEKAFNNAQDAFYAHDAMITTSGAAMLKKPVYWTANNWLEMDVQGASYGPLSFRYFHRHPTD